MKNLSQNFMSSSSFFNENVQNPPKGKHILWILWIFTMVLQCASLTYSDFKNSAMTPENKVRWVVGRTAGIIIIVVLGGLYVRAVKQKKYQQSHRLEIALILLFTACLIASDSLRLRHLQRRITNNEESSLYISFFTLGLEGLWKFGMVTAICNRIFSPIIILVAMFCTYMIFILESGEWFEAARLLNQFVLLTGALIYSEKVKIRAFLENWKLKVEDRFHKSILDSLPEALMIFTSTGKVKFSNKYMKNVFGWNSGKDTKQFFSYFSELKYRNFKIDNEQTTFAFTYDFHKTTREELSSPFGKEKISFRGKMSEIKTIQEILNLFQSNVSQWEKIGSSSISVFDTKYRHPDSETALSVEIRAFILTEDDQTQLTLIFRDTTERDIIATLESENETYRNNIIASFSHELRTPLNANLGMLEEAMLQPDIPKRAKQELIEPALVSAKLLLHMLNDILDYSQILKRKLRLHIQPISLRSTVESCLTLFKERIANKSLALEVDYCTEAEDTISNDPQRISQVLINLLSNALKFTFQGVIKVSVKKEDELCYKLSVIDTGIGMDELTQNRLRKSLAFNKDFGKKIHANSAGIGLGSFISNALCQFICPGLEIGLHCESQVGQGTTFYFYVKDFGSEQSPDFIEKETLLSIANEGEAYDPVDCLLKSYRTQTHSSKMRSSPRLKSESTKEIIKEPVLLVDDEVFNLMVLERFCTNAGLPSARALNGQQAISILQDLYKKGNKIRLVLTDVNMPVMNGYETTIALRKLEEEGVIEKLVIVGVTAYVAEDKIIKCHEAGMNEVVTKPLSQETFQQILRKYDFIE